MFEKDIYVQRRKELRKKVKSGIIVLLGNTEVPMNYRDNPYYFRQDSTFLYYCGLDLPALAAIIDVDQEETVVYGDDISLDDVIWMGPQEALKERSERMGIEAVRPSGELKTELKNGTSKAVL